MEAVPVTVVGPSFSGKTVYLASLFHRLAMQRDDVGFFVQLPAEESKRLNTVYNKIAGPDHWPDPTALSNLHEFEFTCSIRTADNRVFSPFGIKYIDFGGEHMTDTLGKSEVGEAVWQRAEQSKFLLVLLDGVKVLRFLGGDDTLVNELFPVFGLIERSDAVVHFVITKWDVLEAAGHAVRQVVDSLLEHPEFRTCYDNRLRRNATSGALRVIPVSAVGAGFAVLGPDGVNMVKKGRYPRPQNVEVPFMAVLVDLFDQALKDLAVAEQDAGTSTRAQQEAQKLKWIRTAQKRLPMLNAVLATKAVKSPAVRVVQETFLDSFVDFVGRQVDQYGRRVEHDLAALRNQAAQAHSEKEAMTRLIRLFEATLAEFEATHPGSRLLREAS